MPTGCHLVDRPQVLKLQVLVLKPARLARYLGDPLEEFVMFQLVLYHFVSPSPLLTSCRKVSKPGRNFLRLPTATKPSNEALGVRLTAQSKLMVWDVLEASMLNLPNTGKGTKRIPLWCHGCSKTCSVLSLLTWCCYSSQQRCCQMSAAQSSKWFKMPILATSLYTWKQNWIRISVELISSKPLKKILKDLKSTEPVPFLPDFAHFLLCLWTLEWGWLEILGHATVWPLGTSKAGKISSTWPEALAWQIISNKQQQQAAATSKEFQNDKN